MSTAPLPHRPAAHRPAPAAPAASRDSAPAPPPGKSPQGSRHSPLSGHGWSRSTATPAGFSARRHCAESWSRRPAGPPPAARRTATGPTSLRPSSTWPAHPPRPRQTAARAAPLGHAPYAPSPRPHWARPTACASPPNPVAGPRASTPISRCRQRSSPRAPARWSLPPAPRGDNAPNPTAATLRPARAPIPPPRASYPHRARP